MSRVSDTSGMALISSSSWAAIRRSAKPSARELHRVRARMGTSSMERGLISGWLAPAGITSKLEESLL